MSHKLCDHQLHAKWPMHSFHSKPHLDLWETAYMPLTSFSLFQWNLDLLALWVLCVHL